MGFIKRLLGMNENTQQQSDLPNPTYQQYLEYQQILKQNAIAQKQNNPVNRVGGKVREYIRNIPKRAQRAYQNEYHRTRGRVLSAEQVQAIASVSGRRIPIRQKSNIRHVNRNTGRVGRPRGTYDPRYARYGGVIRYRQQMSRLNAIMRLREQQRMQEVMQGNRPSPQVQQQPPIQAQQQAPVQVRQQQMPQQQQAESFNALKIKMIDNRQQQITKPVNTLDVETPMGDKYGDYYTEPDFMSGRQVLRRRSQDRIFRW